MAAADGNQQAPPSPTAPVDHQPPPRRSPIPASTAKWLAVAAAAAAYLQQLGALRHPRFNFRRDLPPALRAALDLIMVCAGTAGTSVLALLQPRLVLTVASTLLAPNATYGVRYGAAPRQTLDLHAPMRGRTAVAAGLPQLPVVRPPRAPPGGLRPLVLFVPGGAWAFGESWQYSPLCRKVAQLGAVAACLSYRLYPAGDIRDMGDDVMLALAFLLEHAAVFRIDPTRVTLVAHSAGAHITLQALCRLAAGVAGEGQAAWLRSSVGVAAPLPLPPASAAAALAAVTGAVLKAGVYDVPRHAAWEATRLPLPLHVVSPMGPVCGGPAAWPAHSPTRVLRALPPAAAAALPPLTFTHSPWDNTAPFDSSVAAATAAARAGVPVHFVPSTAPEMEGHPDVMVALLGGNLSLDSAGYGARLAAEFLRLIAATVLGQPPPGAQPIPEHVPCSGEPELVACIAAARATAKL